MRAEIIPERETESLNRLLGLLTAVWSNTIKGLVRSGPPGRRR